MGETDIKVVLKAKDEVPSVSQKVSQQVRMLGTQLRNITTQRFSITDAINKSFPEQKIKGVSDVITQSMSNIDAQLAKGRAPILSISDALNDSMAKSKGFRSAFDDVRDSVQKSIAPTKTFDDVITKTTNNMKSTTKSVGNLRGMLLGASLSALFFGMAMRNAAMNVWKSGTKAFQEVMHSVEGTVTQFDLLQGSMQYLKFTVGQALEPLAAYLIPIVDRISDWVQQNPELTKNAVTFAAIAGSILLIGGQIGTFAVGMSSLAKSLPVISGLKIPSFSGLASFIASPVGAGVTAALAALITLGGISWKSFKETPEAWEAVKDAFTGFKESEVLTDLFDSIEHFITTLFPDFELSWENIAWTIAWAVDSAVQKLKFLTATLSIVVNTVTLLIDAIKAYISWKRMLESKVLLGEDSDEFKNAKAKLDAVKNSAYASIDGITGAFYSISDAFKENNEILAQTPIEYKKNKLAAQEAAKAAKEYADQIPSDLMTGQSKWNFYSDYEKYGQSMSELAFGNKNLLSNIGYGQSVSPWQNNQTIQLVVTDGAQFFGGEEVLATVNAQIQ